jgi:hypothetical protein
MNKDSYRLSIIDITSTSKHVGSCLSKLDLALTWHSWVSIKIVHCALTCSDGPQSRLKKSSLQMKAGVECSSHALLIRPVTPPGDAYETGSDDKP